MTDNKLTTEFSSPSLRGEPSMKESLRWRRRKSTKNPEPYIRVLSSLDKRCPSPFYLCLSLSTLILNRTCNAGHRPKENTDGRHCHHRPFQDRNSNEVKQRKSRGNWLTSLQVRCSWNRSPVIVVKDVCRFETSWTFVFQDIVNYMLHVSWMKRRKRQITWDTYSCLRMHILISKWIFLSVRDPRVLFRSKNK